MSRRRKAVAAAMVAADLPEIPPKESEPVVELRVPPVLTDEEKRDLVFGLINGTYYPASAVEDRSLLPMVFMPLSFGALDGWDVESIGNLVADMKDAGPRGINGYPMFMSFRVIGKADWREVGERLTATVAAMNAANPGAALDKEVR